MSPNVDQQERTSTNLPQTQEIARFEALTRALYTRMRSEMIRDLNARRLSYSAMLVLSFVNRQGPATMGEIQRELGLARSTVTGLVDTLHGRDLVERQQDPDDRRVIRVQPTPQGVEEINALRAKRVQYLKSAWPSSLSAADLESCNAVLELLVDAL